MLVLGNFLFLGGKVHSLSHAMTLLWKILRLTEEALGLLYVFLPSTFGS